jgi:hypothetical protein
MPPQVTQDIVERAKTMLATIEYAKCKGIVHVYPDSSVAGIVGGLVEEVERYKTRGA